MPQSRSLQLVRGPSRLSVAGVASLGLVLAVIGWGFFGPSARPSVPGTGEAAAALATPRAAVLRIGIANEPPYGYLDTAHNTVTGEAPELARLVLHALGVPRMEVVTTEFRSLIPGLRAGRFDVIAAGMYVTPARCAQVLFSDPSYRIGEAMLVRRGNPAKLHSYRDVAQHPSARLGVVAGSVEVGYAEKSGVPGARIVALKDPSAAVDALRAGHIQAYAGTAFTVRELHDKAHDVSLALAEPFEQPVIDGVETWGYGAFAFRPSDQALRDAFNAELRRVLGTPQHLALVAPFGFTRAELPRGMTAAKLCEPGAGEGA